MFTARFGKGRQLLYPYAQGGHGRGEADKLATLGADDSRLRTVEVLVKGGVAVMGHIGLTPQSYCTLGGFRAQGRHANQVRTPCPPAPLELLSQFLP